MAQCDGDKEKPQILEQKLVAESRLFKIEQVDLQFSNGEKRTYERMKGGGRGAVMVVACPEPDSFYLIRYRDWETIPLSDSGPVSRRIGITVGRKRKSRVGLEGK